MDRYLALFAGLLAGALSAQSSVTAELVTKTPVAAYVRQGNQTDFKALAANVKIPATFTSVDASLNNSFHSTLVDWSTQGAVIVVNLGDQGGVNLGTSGPAPTAGTSPSANVANLQPGPHSFLLKLSGPAGTKGLLEVWSSGGLNVPQGAVHGAYRVDIGDDNSVEFTGVVPGNLARQTFVVQIPTSGTLLVRLEADVQATQLTSGSTLYKMGATIQFTPSPLCVGKPYGDFCSGPLLSGAGQASGSSWLYTLKLTGGTANGIGWLVVGDRPVSVQVPGVQCPLLTNVLVAVPFVLDSVGTANWNFKVSQAVDIDLRVQAADFGTATASNGLHALCLR
jgi:hypothetical protein